MEKDHFKPSLARTKVIASLGAAACFNQLAMHAVQISLNNTLRSYGASSIYRERYSTGLRGGNYQGQCSLHGLYFRYRPGMPAYLRVQLRRKKLFQSTRNLQKSGHNGYRCLSGFIFMFSTLPPANRQYFWGRRRALLCICRKVFPYLLIVYLYKRNTASHIKLFYFYGKGKNGNRYVLNTANYFSAAANPNPTNVFWN